jgi:hypothetical protein
MKMTVIVPSPEKASLLEIVIFFSFALKGPSPEGKKKRTRFLKGQALLWAHSIKLGKKMGGKGSPFST